MNRFLVFGGNNHYPNGGWSDFKNDAESLSEAVEIIAKLSGDWFHVLDLDTGTIVKEFERSES